jgi:transcriptional regulator with XRE-family HTH domain
MLWGGIFLTFKQRLAGLRAENGLRQSDVAEKIGISTTAYRNIETGPSAPSLENLIKLADLFNVSLDYLTGRSEERR